MPCLADHPQTTGADRVAVRFEGVTVTLGGVTVLDDVTASVPAGGSTAIIGPNGAGKTTLLLALLGQIRFRGHIHVEGVPPGKRPRLGYVPQRLAFDRGMPMTVTEFLIMGWQRLPLWLGRHRGLVRRARQLLCEVQAEALAERRLGALSGGEFQRVLLALALGQEPELLVLDEPAAGVDVSGESLFCEILERQRRRRGFTQLMVSHDLATVTHHATHVICLHRRMIAEGPPQVVLTAENLTALFGIHMGLADRRAMPAGEAASPPPPGTSDG